MSAEYPIDHDYEICDTSGTLIAIHRKRVLNEHGDKSFPWVRPDGEPGLPEGVRASELPLFRSEYLKSWSGKVILTEGETAAAALSLAGHHAVGTVTGASGTPSTDVLNSLQGFSVIIWPDADDPGRAHAERIATILHKLSISVSIIDVSGMAAHADAADVTDHDAWLARAVPFRVAQSGDRPQLWGAAEIAAMYHDEVERRMQASIDGRRANLSWGFDHLDALTDGLRPGLICCHAQSGIGKTAFALQVAAQVAAPVLFVTCEMSVPALARRIVSRVHHVSGRELMSAARSVEDEVAMATEALATVPNLHFIDATIVPAKSDFISEQLGWLKHADPHGHALLVIDSLHSWVGPLTADLQDVSEYDGINTAMVALREIAQKHDVPVLFIAERNRAKMQEGGLSAVAGSRAPEYRSDIVLSLDRPEDDDSDPVLPRNLILNVLKNRHGPAGVRVAFTFDGATMSFAEED